MTAPWLDDTFTPDPAMVEAARVRLAEIHAGKHDDPRSFRQMLADRAADPQTPEDVRADHLAGIAEMDAEDAALEADAHAEALRHMAEVHGAPLPPECAPGGVRFEQLKADCIATLYLWRNGSVEMLWSSDLPADDPRRIALEARDLPLLAPFTALDLTGLAVRLVKRADGTSGAVLDVPGLTVPPDDRVEVRLPLRAQVVASQHDTEHDAGRHPFCAACETRALPGRTDVATAVNDRLRRWAYLYGERLPVTSAPAVDVIPLLDAVELAAMPAQSMLVGDFLPAESVGHLQAPGNSFKSFVAVDLAMTVAAGLDEWHGHAVENGQLGGALIVAGEDGRGTAQRLTAWMRHHDVDPASLRGYLHLHDGPVNLFTGGAPYDALLASVREHRPALLVLDTLQTLTVGADGNSAADAGIVNGRLRALQRACGGTVLVVSHSGKASGSVRGSSAWEDDSDWQIVAERHDGAVTLRVKKLKNAADGTSLTLHTVAVGESLVLTKNGAAAPAVTWSSSSNDNRVLTALKLLASTGPAGTAAIGAVVDQDGHPSMNRGTLHRVIGRLVDKGDVVQPKPSSRLFLLATSGQEP